MQKSTKFSKLSDIELIKLSRMKSNTLFMRLKTCLTLISCQGLFLIIALSVGRVLSDIANSNDLMSLSIVLFFTTIFLAFYEPSALKEFERRFKGPSNRQLKKTAMSEGSSIICLDIPSINDALFITAVFNKNSKTMQVHCYDPDWISNTNTELWFFEYDMADEPEFIQKMFDKTSLLTDRLINEKLNKKYTTICIATENGELHKYKIALSNNGDLESTNELVYELFRFTKQNLPAEKMHLLS